MLNTTKGLRAVCIFDPSIAQAGTKVLMEYARSRDYSALEPHIKKGELPTIYHFRRLSRSVMDRFVDLHTSGEARWVAAFQYGVTQIDKLRQEDGTRIDWKPTGKTATPEGDIPTVSDEEMNAGIISRHEYFEIGRVIYDKSCLPVWLAPAFLPPPTSLELLTRPGLSVGASQPTAPLSNSEPSDTGSQKSDKIDPDSEKSESKSESHTGATAGAK
jgi:hypothetical protein